MRKIILDLEATGSRNKNAQRICEIGAIEFDDNYLPVTYYHQYVNPVLPVAYEGFKIHKLSNDFLGKHPRFHVIADSIIEYLQGAEIYAHAAKNDRYWLDRELAKYHLPQTEELGCKWVDTLKIAQQHPEITRPGIDGLCEYYGMDTSLRFKHSAIADCALLLSILPLIDGHETQGWEPEDICSWINIHKGLNRKKKFPPPRKIITQQMSLQLA